MIDWLIQADSVYEEAKEIRKILHRHPETGNKEFFTSAFIKKYLEKNLIPYQQVLETGIVATIEGSKEGKTVGLRTDIDALPIREATGCDFQSENEGTMHACGHDMHMTAVLAAAKLLNQHKEEIQGKIHFIFQPDEEGNGGAERIIQTGVLEGTNAVFGCHIDPNLPKDTVGIRYGDFYANSDMFFLTVHGESCHGATPEKGHDALACGCELVSRLRELPSQFVDKTVLTVGRFNAGTVTNIVSDKAQIDGMIRSFGKENRSRMKQLFMEVCQQVTEKYGCTIEINYVENYMSVVNPQKETAFVENCATELFGKDKVVLIDAPKMIAEDFSYYIDKYSGCYYHASANCMLPLHHDHFLPEEAMLKKMIALHCKVVFDYLNEDCI